MVGRLAFHGKRSWILNKTLIFMVVKQPPTCQDISEYAHYFQFEIFKVGGRSSENRSPPYILAGKYLYRTELILLSQYTSKTYDLEDAFCRNPDSSSRSRPWCWVMDGMELRAEDCQIPKCSEYCSTQE